MIFGTSFIVLIAIIWIKITSCFRFVFSGGWDLLYITKIFKIIWKINIWNVFHLLNKWHILSGYVAFNKKLLYGNSLRMITLWCKYFGHLKYSFIEPLLRIWNLHSYGRYGESNNVRYAIKTFIKTIWLSKLENVYDLFVISFALEPPLLFFVYFLDFFLLFNNYKYK